MLLVGVNTRSFDETSGEQSCSGRAALENADRDASDGFDAAGVAAHRCRAENDAKQFFGFGSDGIFAYVFTHGSEGPERDNKVDTACICRITTAASVFKGRLGHAVG